MQMRKLEFQAHCRRSDSSDSRFCRMASVFSLPLGRRIPKSASNAPASSSNPPSGTRATDSQGQSDDQPVDTLKVNVEVVQLFFNVKTSTVLSSQPEQDRFRHLRGWPPQTIKYFKAESDLPLTLGILIDSSGSQQRVLEMEKEVGASFLESTLRQKDEAFVISFDVDITLLQDFTNSVSRLRHGAQRGEDQYGRRRLLRWPDRTAGSDSLLVPPVLAAPLFTTPYILLRMMNSVMRLGAKP